MFSDAGASGLKLSCRGFRQTCPNEAVYRVTVAYEGARQFPSEYDLCVSCEAETWQMMRRLREKHGDDNVDYRVFWRAAESPAF